jgi:hypothetical protein
MAALSIRYEGPRATITLTQPEVRNAFSDEVIAEITAAFTEVGPVPMCAPWCWRPKAPPSAPAPT